MIEIEFKIDEEWASPPEGFNEDIEEDDDFDVENLFSIKNIYTYFFFPPHPTPKTTRFGMNSIDRLIAALGDEETIPSLSETVQKLL